MAVLTCDVCNCSEVIGLVKKLMFPTTLQDRPHRLQMPILCCIVDTKPTCVCLYRQLLVTSNLQEDFQNLDMSILRSAVGAQPSRVGLHEDELLSSKRDQLADHSDVSVAASCMQGRVTGRVDGEEVCLSADEQVDHLRIPHERRYVQDAGLVAISCGDFASCHQQQVHALLVAVGHDSKERWFAQLIEFLELLEDQPSVLAHLKCEGLAILLLVLLLLAEQSEEIRLHQPVQVEDGFLRDPPRHPITSVVVQPKQKLAERHLLELRGLQHRLGIILVIVEPRGGALGIEVVEFRALSQDGGFDLVMSVL
mmetsp:Transcript_11738/g.26932  ORF Transcript_11738/g.26932 Transcript_11738/m.26932 type:complete len:310 (+) Transcript_11738:1812-2741(+)